MFRSLQFRRDCLLVPGLAIFWIRPGFLTLAALLALDLARAQLPPISTNHAAPGYVITAWQQEQGLSQRAITAIVQTSDGYLWLGTYNGLVRFDGVRFTVFDESSTPPLMNERVTSLLEDAAGVLWIGHESGELTRRAGGQFTPVPLGAGWPTGAVGEITQDNQGEIWLLGERGAVMRLNDRLLLPLGPAAGTGSVPPAFASGPGGPVCVLLNGGLLRLANGAWVTLSNSVPATGKVLRRACPSRAGGVWVVGEGRLRRWQEEPSGPGRLETDAPAGRWVQDLGACPWGEQLITAMLETRSGKLLLGTLADGLFLWQPGGRVERLTRAEGLSAHWIRSLAEDREGNLWVGTGGGGLNALRPRLVESYDFPAEWADSVPQAVCVAAEGDLWVGTEGNGLARFRAGVFERPAFNATLPNPYLWSVLEARDGGLWVGSWGGGLRVWREAAWQVPTGFVGNPGPVLALYEGRGGEMWVGTRTGLARWTPAGCEWFTETNGLVSPDVRAVVEDAAGTVWFGLAGGGLASWQAGRIQQYRRADGLPSDFVWALLPEADGTLWIATRGGLGRYRNGRCAAVRVENGLPSSFLTHIADDGLGYLWFGSADGIFRASKADLNRCADGLTASVSCLAYGRAEGMNAPACMGGFQPAGCRTTDGRLWFPTSKGLVAVNPTTVRTNLLTPPVVIEQLRVDGVTLSLPQPVEVAIASGWHDLEFQFTGLSFVAPEKVRFRWQLEGWEPGWTEGGSARRVSYRFLPPGSYRFRVTACNNDGVWNPIGATLAFRVPPAFWQTWWFRGATAAGVLAALVGVALLMQRRKYRLQLADLERRRAVERERLRIAQDIHDEVGSSLTRVGMLAESAESAAPPDDPNRARIQGIAATTRQIVQAMDEIVWAVNPRNDTLTGFANYLVHFAEDLLRHSSVQFQLRVPVRLPDRMLLAEARHNLFLAAKEALHNAVKHAGARQIELHLACEHDRLTVTVHDDGRGFNPASVELAGDGLLNMRERVESLGGRFRLHSVPGQGTTVELDLPLPDEGYSAVTMP